MPHGATYGTGLESKPCRKHWWEVSDLTGAASSPLQLLSHPRIIAHRVKFTFSVNTFISFEFDVVTTGQRLAMFIQTPPSLCSFYHISSYLERLTMLQSQCTEFKFFQFPSKCKLKHFSNTKFYSIKRPNSESHQKGLSGKYTFRKSFLSEFYGM